MCIMTGYPLKFHNFFILFFFFGRPLYYLPSDTFIKARDTPSVYPTWPIDTDNRENLRAKWIFQRSLQKPIIDISIPKFISS